MHWRIRAVFDWFARPFRPKGWCDRCRVVHTQEYRNLEEELVQHMAKQIEEEIDRWILAELEKVANCAECREAKSVGAVCSRHGDPWRPDEDLGSPSEPGGTNAGEKEEPK